VSQREVSVIELDGWARSPETLRRVASALEASVDLAPRWRGPELAALLDADHAALVERVVSALTDAGWESIVEWSFNHFGERGAIDVVGWNAPERALLVTEVKSRLVEVGGLHAGVDRKIRVASTLLPKERGWDPSIVGAVVILPGEPTVYDAARRHAATFEARSQLDCRGAPVDPPPGRTAPWSLVPRSHQPRWCSIRSDAVKTSSRASATLRTVTIRALPPVGLVLRPTGRRSTSPAGADDTTSPLHQPRWCGRA
jgi:hypothetical protein